MSNKGRKHSSEIVDGVEQAPSRAMLRAVGFKEEDFKKPLKDCDFLEIEKVEINSEKKHMVGGWQWEDEKMKNLMMKKNPIKSFLKVLIPFKGLRKNIIQCLK